MASQLPVKEWCQGSTLHGYKALFLFIYLTFLPILARAMLRVVAKLDLPTPTEERGIKCT